MDRQVVVIEDVAFFLCTLWTDFNLFGDPDQAMRKAKASMSDFRLIRVRPQGDVLTPLITHSYTNGVFVGSTKRCPST